MASETEVLKVGTIAKFAGYADLEEGMEEILTAGQRVVVVEVKPDNQGFAVAAIDDDGHRLNVDGGVWQEGEAILGDTLFASELTDIEAPADETPQEDLVDDLTVATIAKMKSKELDDAASRFGVPVPDGFAKMKVADKRAVMTAWLSEAETQAEEVADEANVPEVNTTAPDPTPETAEATTTLPEAVAGSELVPTMSDSASVAELLAEKDAVTAAKDLIAQEQRTLYTLGGVLKHINETGSYKSYGFDGKKGFEEFCEAELGIKYRKARYLIDIYQTFQQVGIDEAELDKIGWSKAAVLARVPVDQLQSNIDALLETATTSTRDELIEHVKENYEVATRAETVKKTTFTFKVVEADAETVRAALEHAKLLVEDGDINKAFLHICGDWMNTAEGSDLDLDSFMELALARFGAEAIRAKMDEAEIDTSAEPTAETA